MKRYCQEPGVAELEHDINGDYVKAEGPIRALQAATAAIYFADSSDYLSALLEIVRHLSPEIADIMERSERKAYEAAQELSGAVEE